MPSGPTEVPVRVLPLLYVVSMRGPRWSTVTVVRPPTVVPGIEALAEASAYGPGAGISASGSKLHAASRPYPTSTDRLLFVPFDV